ncbi:MAG: NifU family protein [Alphaproteobacteria bacterium]|nr:NifU family protein [Alphaproteobacteria bacterium]
MLIKTEDLAEKCIINFYLPSDAVLVKNTMLFISSENCDNDFIREIFSTDGIIYCLLTENMISVKYADKNDKDDIKALTLACIDDCMQGAFNLPQSGGCKNLIQKCEALADALIRPTLNRDKGDIIIFMPSNDVLQVQFTGHCAGCPYAQNTLQNIIIKTFKRYLPQITEVRLKE